MIMSLKQLAWSFACALLLASTNASSWTRRDTSGKQTERRTACSKCNNAKCKGCEHAPLVERGVEKDTRTKERARSRNPKHNHVHHYREHSDPRKRHVTNTPVASAE